MNRWKPMIYIQTKSNVSDIFLQSGSLCNVHCGHCSKQTTHQIWHCTFLEELCNQGPILTHAMSFMIFWFLSIYMLIADTVFPRIVSAETILFWKWKMRKFSYIVFPRIVSAETILFWIWPWGSTLTSQDYNSSSVVYVPEPIRAI